MTAPTIGAGERPRLGARSRASTGRRPAARPRLRLVPSAAAPDEKNGPVAAAQAQTTLGVTMVVLVIVLSLIGSVMILSASSVEALAPGGSPFGVFVKQCVWMVIGLACLAIGARVDYRRWSALVPVLVIGVLGLLVAVLLPGIGRNVNGAQRWLGVGELQLQPSEPAKFALVVFVAALVAREGDRIADLRVVFRPVMIVLGLIVGLVLLQPNLGTSIVLCAIVACMLFWAGLPLRVLVALGAVGVTLGTFFALSAPYRRARVTAFLDPWGNAEGTAYQTIQSLIGVASGGLTGTGLGASRAKWGFLPEAHTDFVFAIIGEELGLLGAAVVIGLFVGMIVCGLRIATRATDRLGAMLAVGITAWFSVQAFVNVGAVLSLLPITGVPLPFVSFGGSSLMMTMLAAGVLVNVALQGDPPLDPVRARIAERRAANARRGARRGASRS